MFFFVLGTSRTQDFCQFIQNTYFFQRPNSSYRRTYELASFWCREERTRPSCCSCCSGNIPYCEENSQDFYVILLVFSFCHQAQTSEPSPAPAAVNGSEAYPPAMPAQQQRNNFRAPRPPMGNGRVAGNPVGPGVVSNAAPPMAASGPGSYNRERDQDRGIFLFSD